VWGGGQWVLQVIQGVVGGSSIWVMDVHSLDGGVGCVIVGYRGHGRGLVVGWGCGWVGHGG